MAVLEHVQQKCAAVFRPELRKYEEAERFRDSRKGGKALGGVAVGSVLALAMLTQAASALAASNPPRIGIPPRNTNSVICDTRGCFGFGARQFYTRPGQPLPDMNGVNRYDSPRIQMAPRETYTPPRQVYPSPAQQRSRHQMWCARQHRTYNPGTNLYSTINNGFQECRAPFD